MVHQIKVTLKGIRPPVWRRFRVKSDIGGGLDPEAFDLRDVNAVLRRSR